MVMSIGWLDCFVSLAEQDFISDTVFDYKFMFRLYIRTMFLRCEREGERRTR